MTQDQLQPAPRPRHQRRLRQGRMRNQHPATAYLVSLCYLALLGLYGYSNIRTIATAAAGSTPRTTLTLRVRMPDGAVQRLQASAGDTVDILVDKLGMEGNGVGLSIDAAGDAAAPTASVAALGLGNGDFLYVKSDLAAEETSKAKARALDRMKAAAAGVKARGNQFVPFPDYARPPPPRATKRVKTWQDLEAMQAQTFSLKPQKDSNVKKISVEQSSMDNFVGHLKATGLGKHRCALLFGRISPSTKGIKVEAMYEPEQLSAAGGSYDATALTSAAAAVMAADDGDDNTDARSCRAAAVDDITRAVRVAELLGLRLVGWCLSHDAREHFMAARDVVTAAAIQLWSMREKGEEDGVLVATVAVSVNQTNGEVATEAFSVSNQTVQIYSEGVLADDQPDPTAGRATTTAVVKEGGEETTMPETLGMICNVAIVQHEGVLQTRFPAANRGGKTQSLSDLKACLFGSVPAVAAPASAAGGTKKKQKQPSFLKRLSDFQLLVFLSRQIGFSRDFEELCALVQKRDIESPALGKLKVVLENLCDRDGT